MINENVVKGLDNATRTSDAFAYLIDSNSKSVYTFLFNPESKSFSRQAYYAEAVTAITSTPSQQYNFTSGLTLQLPNLILESYNRNKTCKSLLQNLQSLMVANPKQGKFAPTTVTFKWGVDTFGPAVITDIDWAETSWLNGEVASARVSLTLLEVPSKESQKPPSGSQDKLQQSLNKDKGLTNRQKTEASTKAKKWLGSNVKKLQDDKAVLVRAYRYKLLTSKEGVVAMTDLKNRTIGTVGVYRDGKFYTTNSTLIKSKK